MEQPVEDVPHVRPHFETVYAIGLSFLRQSLRWLGVAERDVDDVLQDVMLAAYRRLDSFDPTHAARAVTGARFRSATSAPPCAARAVATTPGEPLKRWLFGIAWRQVGHYRGRAYRRREVAV